MTADKVPSYLFSRIRENLRKRRKFEKLFPLLMKQIVIYKKKLKTWKK